MRATFYARVSTDSDEQKKSIISQVDFFQEYLKKNNYKPAESGIFYKRDGVSEKTKGYYVDEGFSGAKSFKFRKAFQQMILDAQAKKFDIIFTKSISRFGRNAQETLKYIGDLKEIGIGVYFEDLNINTLDSKSDFALGIFSFLAQEESRLKSVSVQFGKMAGYKKGIWGGREPYGYNIKDGKLIINEHEAEIVKEVFYKYINLSMGLRNIAKSLNEKGISTKSGKTIFDQSLISKILKNAVYIGEIRLHRTKKIDINRNIIASVPDSEQIVIQDETIRIIDNETFRMVQIEKEKRFEQFGSFNYKNTIVENEDGQELNKLVRKLSRGESRHSNTHLFSNLLKCGNCNGSLRRKVQKNKKNTFLYWFCRNNDQFGKHKCGFRNLQHEEKLIEFIKIAIIDYKNRPNKSKFYLDKILKNKFDLNNLDARVEEIKGNIRKINYDIELNFSLLSDQTITREQFKPRNEKLLSDLYDEESNLNQLVYIEDEIEKVKARYNQFIKALNEVDVENLTNSILRKFISKIVAETHEEPIFDESTFERNSLTIEWNFMNSNEKDILREWSKSIKPLSNFLETTDKMVEQMANEISNKRTKKELLHQLSLQE